VHAVPLCLSAMVLNRSILEDFMPANSAIAFKSLRNQLQVEEVLLLWDRIIGMDSLLPVTVLAVAVVCFR